MTRSRLSGAAQAGLWGVASQGLNAASNLALAIFVARDVSSEAFGAWAIGFASYAFVLQLLRAGVTTPLLIADQGTPQTDTEGGAVAVSLFIGLLATVLLLLASTVTSSNLERTFEVFAIGLPVLLVQDAARHIAFRRRDARAAALMDLSWVVLFLSGAALSFLWPGGVLERLTLAWAGCSVVGAVWFLARTGVAPSRRAGARYWRSHRLLGRHLLAESVVAAGPAHFLPLLVAAASGLAAAGGFRAGQTLLGGIAILIAGLTPVATVEVKPWVGSRRTAAAAVGAWSLVVFLASAAYGFGLFLVPEQTGVVLLGDLWAAAEPLVLPLTLASALRGPITGVMIVLKARLQVRAVLRLRLATTGPALALPFAGAVLDGARGASWGLALSTMLAGLLSLYGLVRAPTWLR